MSGEMVDVQFIKPSATLKQKSQETKRM